MPLPGRLDRRATWRTAGVGLGIIVLSNVAMGAYLLPNIAARRPEAVHDGFLVMIDLAPLLPPAGVYRIFDLYTPDVLGLVRQLYAVDFVFPLGFALVLLTLIGKSLRYLGAHAGPWRACLLLPFVGLLFDYAENTLALLLLHAYQSGQVFPALARVASVATACKFAGLTLAGLATLTLLLRAAARRLASRARPRV